MTEHHEIPPAPDTRELDADYASWTKRQRRGLIVFLSVEGVVTIAFAVVLVLFFLSIRGSCAFYRDIATVPIAPNASQLGVQIVSDSRTSFETLHCSGTLPPPQPELIKLAEKYGIPIPH